MEWDNDRVLDFIKEYQKREILWKKEIKDYHNTTKKEDAWREIAEVMETGVDVLKKKMDSLRGSRRREKHRMINSNNTRRGRKESYISSWFAWEKMKFLDNLKKTRDTIDTYPASENEDADVFPPPNSGSTGDTDLIDPREQNTSVPDQSSSTSDERGRRTVMQPNTKGLVGKRKFKSPKELAPRKRGEDPQILKSRKAGTIDECSMFADYLCEKMRKFDGVHRSILMYEIHTLILKTELGTISQTSQSSPLSNYHSLSSSPQLSLYSPFSYSLPSPHFNSSYFSPISSPLSLSTPSPHTPCQNYSSPLPSPHNNPSNFSHSPSPQIYPYNSSPGDSALNLSSEPTSNKFADTVTDLEVKTTK